jgi:peptidoglycan/xylan/chitin deacetylase (PgdA/CDA1 family)
MNKTIITTSWDDGDKSDLKLLELLNKYGIKGTFYIPAKNQLTAQEIKMIDRSQEVGAHTVNHRRLAEIDLKPAEQEIIESKKFLTDILGRSPKMFCYPYGSFNEEIKKIVKSSGFSGARTVKTFCFDKPTDLFELDTTMNIYPFPFRKKDKNHFYWSGALWQPMVKYYPEIFKKQLPLGSYFSWLALTKNLIKSAEKEGGVFHLWGHSWEIEKYGLWGDLEKILKYLSQRPDSVFLTNSEVIEYYKL